MAVVNARTIDNAQIIKYYRTNSQGGLISLSFCRVKIDADLDFYEPCSFVEVGASGQRKQGAFVRSEILPKNLALPRSVVAGEQDKRAIWQLGNV